MPRIEDPPVLGTYEYAGAIAEAWFERLGGTIALTNRERDEVLDVALADAGVTPLPPGHEFPAFPGHSVRV